MFLPHKRPDRQCGLPSLVFYGCKCCFPGVKRPGRKVNHTPSSSAEIKKKWGCKSTPSLRPRGVDSENLPLNFTVNIFIKQYCTESQIKYGSK
jgi:hypothetical protein